VRLYAEPVSPLQHTEIGTEKLLSCAQHGIPCVCVSGIMAGGNAPVTLAGAADAKTLDAKAGRHDPLGGCRPLQFAET